MMREARDAVAGRLALWDYSDAASFGFHSSAVRGQAEPAEAPPPQLAQSSNDYYSTIMMLTCASRAALSAVPYARG